MNAAPTVLSRGVLVTIVVLAIAAVVGYGLTGTRFPEMAMIEPGGPEVKVELPNGTGGAVRFFVDGTFEIEHRRRGRETFLPWRRGIGRGPVDFLAARSGIRVTAPDGTILTEAVTGVLRLRARTLRRAGAETPVWGAIEIERMTDDELRAVNVIDMETYVQGVVNAEMGARFSLEALKAQAVAARTYAWAKILEARRRGKDRILHRTVFDQVFRPVDRVPDRIARAVRETRGELLGSRQAPITAFYHSTCGGRTRNAAPSFAPSSPIKGARCEHCRRSRFYRWRRDYSFRTLADALRRAGVRAPIRSVRAAAVGPNGRVDTFEIAHAKGKTRIAGLKFRAAVNRVARKRSEQLLSTFVTLTPTPGGIRVDGRGWGHGVGMCQMGASALGRNGLSYLEILGHYYAGIPVSRGWDRVEP